MTLMADVFIENLKLLPFYNFLFWYFILVHNSMNLIWSTLLKCAPIVCLMFYLFCNGFVYTIKHRISRRILCGLIFSGLGDMLLNVDLFEQGMAAFAVTQLCYISVFGWTPLKFEIGMILYTIGAIFILLFINSLDGILLVALPIYTILLLTMCWRALAQAIEKPKLSYVLCAIGSILFVISDGLIAIDLFLYRIPNARIFIMLTYYLAQFLITFSTTFDAKPAHKMKK